VKKWRKKSEKITNDWISLEKKGEMQMWGYTQVGKGGEESNDVCLAKRKCLCSPDGARQYKENKNIKKNHLPSEKQGWKGGCGGTKNTTQVEGGKEE